MDSVLFAPSVYQEFFVQRRGALCSFPDRSSSIMCSGGCTARGGSYADRNLVLYCRQKRQPGKSHRLTVGVKLGHAVVRNRIRGRLREIYRLHEAQFLPGWDIVVVARARAVAASYQQLERSYLALAAEAGILREAEA